MRLKGTAKARSPRVPGDLTRAPRSCEQSFLAGQGVGGAFCEGSAPEFPAANIAKARRPPWLHAGDGPLGLRKRSHQSSHPLTVGGSVGGDRPAVNPVSPLAVAASHMIRANSTRPRSKLGGRRCRQRASDPAKCGGGGHVQTFGLGIFRGGGPDFRGGGAGRRPYRESRSHSITVGRDPKIQCNHFG